MREIVTLTLTATEAAFIRNAVRKACDAYDREMREGLHLGLFGAEKRETLAKVRAATDKAFPDYF